MARDPSAAEAATAVEGGFADPVFATQAVFRATMDAFAQPGTLVEFGAVTMAPTPLVPAAATLMATLADVDTPIWMANPDGAGAAAARWLRFHTGAPITADPASAVFALLPDGDTAEAWDRFAFGSPDYPDRSATLLLPLRAFRGGTPLTLTGPGIEASRTIAPCGLPSGFCDAMAANHARFPLGFDLVLVSGTAAMALPRTTRIRES